MDLAPMILPSVDRKEVARVLDEVAEPTRMRSIAELGRRELASLFDAAADNEPLTLEHFVPSNPQMAGGANVQPLLIARP